MTKPTTWTEIGAPSASAETYARSRGRFLVVTSATVLCVYLCIRLALPFAPALVWGITTAVVTHRLSQWLAQRIASPNLRAGIGVGLVAIVLVAPLIGLVYFSAIEVAGTVTQWQEERSPAEGQRMLSENPQFSEAWRWLSENLDLAATAQQIAQQVSSGAMTIASGFAYFVFQALLMLFILFFLYRDEHAVIAAARRLSPLSDDDTREVLGRLQDTVYATVLGSLTVALVQGVLGGFVFWILGLPGPVVWGAVMGILSMVPNLGSFVVWAPAALFLAATGQWMKAGVLVGWGVLVIGSIDNLLYPHLVGDRLRQHTVIIFIAIIGGVTVFGATGIVLGPVVVTLAQSLLEIWRRGDDGNIIESS
jgi:predicted PurR-regulated permease PerM